MASPPCHHSEPRSWISHHNFPHTEHEGFPHHVLPARCFTLQTALESRGFDYRPHPCDVLLGYGGRLVLTLMTLLGLYQPEPTDGDPLRERLVAWPDRNREVMRTDGRVTLPLRP